MVLFLAKAINGSQKGCVALFTLFVYSMTYALGFAGLDQVREMMNEEEFTKAREILGKALTDPEQEALASVLFCELETLVGNGEAAYKHGKRAVELLPEDSNAHFWFAKAVALRLDSASMFGKAGFAKEMREAMGRAVELDPKNKDALALEIEFYSSAPAIAGGSLEIAEKKMKVMKDLDKVLAYSLQGQIYSSKKEYDKAEEQFRLALGLEPDNASIIYKLGFAVQKNGRYKEADEIFSRIGKEEGAEYYKAIYQIARTRVLGNYDINTAISLLEQYVELRPENGKGLVSKAGAYWRMGLAHEALNENKKAIWCYEKALELNPEHKNSKKALSKLKSSF